VSELKARHKWEKTEWKDECKAELKVKDAEKMNFGIKSSSSRRNKRMMKLRSPSFKASFLRRGTHWALGVGGMYIATCHNIDALTEVNKELNSKMKKLKKQSQDDQLAKFQHNEKMLDMHLQHNK
jgi:hypothetical protein